MDPGLQAQRSGRLRGGSSACSLAIGRCTWQSPAVGCRSEDRAACAQGRRGCPNSLTASPTVSGSHPAHSPAQSAAAAPTAVLLRWARPAASGAAAQGTAAHVLPLLHPLRHRWQHTLLSTVSRAATAVCPQLQHPHRRLLAARQARSLRRRRPGAQAPEQCCRRCRRRCRQPPEWGRVCCCRCQRPQRHCHCCRRRCCSVGRRAPPASLPAREWTAGRPLLAAARRQGHPRQPGPEGHGVGAAGVWAEHACWPGGLRTCLPQKQAQRTRAHKSNREARRRPALKASESNSAGPRPWNTFVLHKLRTSNQTSAQVAHLEGFWVQVGQA